MLLIDSATINGGVNKLMDKVNVTLSQKPSGVPQEPGKAMDGNNSTSKTKKRKQNPFLSVTARVRAAMKNRTVQLLGREFGRQKVLKLIILDAIANTENYSEAKFFTTYENLVKRLSNTIDWDCMGLSVDPYAVSQNIILEGNGAVNNVFQKGLIHTYGENATLLNRPVFTNNEVSEYVISGYTAEELGIPLVSSVISTPGENDSQPSIKERLTDAAIRIQTAE